MRKYLAFLIIISVISLSFKDIFIQKNFVFAQTNPTNQKLPQNLWETLKAPTPPGTFNNPFPNIDKNSKQTPKPTSTQKSQSQQKPPQQNQQQNQQLKDKKQDQQPNQQQTQDQQQTTSGGKYKCSALSELTPFKLRELGWNWSIAGLKLGGAGIVRMGLEVLKGAVKEIPVIGGAIEGLVKATTFLSEQLTKFGAILVGILSFIDLLGSFICFFIFKFFEYTVARVIDYFAVWNPFKDPQPVAEAVYITFRNFGFLIMLFTGLFVGFKTILKGFDFSRELFHILLVAFFIFFAYAIISEIYLVIDNIYKGMLGDAAGQIGTALNSAVYYLNIKNNLLITTIASIDPPEDSYLCTYLKSGMLDIFADVIWKGATVAEAGGAFLEVLKLGAVLIFVNVLSVIFVLAYAILFILLAVILFFRYFFIVFLTGLASLALATTLIPELPGRFRGITAGFRDFFDWWIRNLSNWIVIGPLLVIFLVLCLSAQSTILELTKINLSNESIESSFFQNFLLGGYLMMCPIVALVITVKLAGTIGTVTTSAVIGGMAFLGGVGAGWLARKSGVGVGMFLERTGEKLTEKAPTPMFARIGTQIKRMGTGIKESSIKPIVDMETSRLDLFAEKIKTAKTDSERDEYINKITKIFNKYRSNPDVLTGIISSDKFKNLPFNKILSHPKGLETFTSKDLSYQAKNKINEIIKNLDSKTVQNIFGNKENLEMIIKAHPEILGTFAEKISGLNQKEILEILSKNEINNIINSLEEGSVLRKFLNKATQGLLESVNKKDLTEISNSIAKLNKEIWATNPQIVFNYLKASGLEKEQTNIFKKSLEIDPEILKESLKGGIKETLNVFGDAVQEMKKEGILDKLKHTERRAFNLVLEELKRQKPNV